MKTIRQSFTIFSILFTLVFAFGVLSAEAAPTVVAATPTKGEIWKSYRPDYHYTLGASVGLGLIDTTAGGTIIGNAGALIANGLIPEIVNPIFAELQFGPMFAEGNTYWHYSAHARWDFVKDRDWTFFALGGLAGNIVDRPSGNRFAIHPRFGVGAFYDAGYFLVRMDVSHELTLIGLTYPF